MDDETCGNPTCLKAEILQRSTGVRCAGNQSAASRSFPPRRRSRHADVRACLRRRSGTPRPGAADGARKRVLAGVLCLAEDWTQPG